MVTIEFENLPVAPLAELAERVPMHPAPAVLAICQDRLREKAFLAQIGVATAPWRAVQDAQGLAAALAELNGPVVLKTARFGYDGKGQLGLGPGDDPAAAWARFGGGPAVAEARIDFAPRDLGDHGAWPGRLRGRLPAGREPPSRRRPGADASPRRRSPRRWPRRPGRSRRGSRASSAWSGCSRSRCSSPATDGCLVNELAPRPHNSGHWTIDACAISQFEQLVRAVCGLPLIDPGRFADAVMDNLLGPAIAAWPELLAEPGARLHLYGKREVRAGRKLGHVTRLDPPHLRLTRPQLVRVAEAGRGPDKARALARAVVGNQVLWKGVPIFSAPPSARSPLRR